MKRIIFILIMFAVVTSVVSSIVYSAPPANVGYVGTLLPVNGDDKNDIGTSTNEFRNLYLSRGLTTTSTTATSTFAGGLTAGGSTGLYVLQNGYVGIGNTSPTNRFSVSSGFIDVNGTTGGYKIDNYLILQASSTSNSIMVGRSAGTSLLSDGIDNIAIGYLALGVATSSDKNIAIGSSALRFNTTGNQNVALGYLALTNNTTGYDNFGLGSNALQNNTTGIQNVAIGVETLQNSTSGQSNIGIGKNALRFNTTGSNNIVLGSFAGYYNLSATSTIAIGANAGRGTANYSSQGGVYLGYQAGYSASTGGNYNTMLGYSAGYNVTTGSSNIIIGQNVNATSSDSVGGLNIGNVLFGTGMYTGGTVSAAPVQGSAIGVGSTTPLGKFSIQGFANGTMPIATFATSSATNVYKTVFNIDKDGTLDTKYGIFCEMYGNNAMVTTSVPTGTTYTKINAFGSTTQAISSKYCTPTPASSILTITKAGKYRANVSVSFSGTSNIDFKGALFVDGIERDNIHWERKLGTGGDVGAASASGYFTATSTSVVDFRVRHTDGGTNNFVTQYGNINVEYIGE